MSRGELSNYQKTQNYLSLTKARALNKILAKSKEPTRWLLRLGKMQASPLFYAYRIYLHNGQLCYTRV